VGSMVDGWILKLIGLVGPISGGGWVHSSPWVAW